MVPTPCPSPVGKESRRSPSDLSAQPTYHPRMRHALAVLALSLLGAACVHRGPADAVVATPLGARMDDYLTRLSGYGYSGATLVAKDGRLLLRKGYGLANDATGTPVTPATVFDIGSLAKVFTAAAVLLLEERGRLSLDDSIARYLDGVPEDKRAITLRQLLAHTSGLDSDFPYENPSAEDYEEVDRDEAVRRILAMPLVDRPGAHFAYSNPGYVLAAAIVEHAGGKPFREFLRQELLEPAGMRSTGFWGSGLPPVPEARLARSYDEDGETADLRKRSSTTWFDLGGGEMVSKVDDLYAWLEALRSERLFPGIWDALCTPGEPAGEHGLGLFIDHVAGTRRIHHGGDYIGFGAELAYYPDAHLVIVNLANRRHEILGTRYAADRVLPAMAVGERLEMWPGEPFDLPPRWSAALPETLRRAVGAYRLPTGGELVISPAGDDALSIAARGQDAVDVLYPGSPDELALRRRSTERVVAMMEGVRHGDMSELPTTLREGAPLEQYRVGLTTLVDGKEHGPLRAIEPIGTVPAAFPRGSRNTVLAFQYEHGTEYIRFGWNKKQDRVMNLGGASDLLGKTPLRASPDSGLVGWNIVSGRALRLSLRAQGAQVAAIALERPDGSRTLAERPA